MVTSPPSSTTLDSSVEAAVAFLRSQQQDEDEGKSRLRLELCREFLSSAVASDCEVRLLVAEDGFPGGCDSSCRSMALDFCLEEGVELVDFTEDDNDDDDDGHEGGGDGLLDGSSAKRRPMQALQACMWSNMVRKDTTAPAAAQVQNGNVERQQQREQEPQQQEEDGEPHQDFDALFARLGDFRDQVGFQSFFNAASGWEFCSRFLPLSGLQLPGGFP